MNLPLAGVFGCEGVELSEAEFSCFRATNPAGLILFKRNCATKLQTQRLVAQFREAVQRPNAIVMIDEEGGTVQRLLPPEWPQRPSFRQLGLLAEADLALGIQAVKDHACAIGLDLLELGIDICLAPVLDVSFANANPEVVGERVFSTDPKMVLQLGQVFVNQLLSLGVSPTIKHLPGHGRTEVDTHFKPFQVNASLQQLQTTDFVPFQGVLKNTDNAMFGLVSHLVYTALDASSPATFSAKVTRFIRQQLGFQGLLLTDCLWMEALGGTLVERAKRAVAAGLDLPLSCHGSVKEKYELAEQALKPLTKPQMQVLHKKPTPNFTPQRTAFEYNAAASKAVQPYT